ncbi:hypothetical protein [Streptomyces sp. NPDC057702]|uniref:hypothetical protein n=1 Tax=unclassified Streptomyces TaxID=2593676 RepID=UPI0036A45225
MGEAGARARVLTGEHTVRTVSGGVLRFFLADAWWDDPGCEWTPATDVEFQLAYEMSLFDQALVGRGRLGPNAGRVQVGLDALAGAGSFFWSDGDGDAGIMTTNGKAPEDCGLGLADVRSLAERGRR